MRASITASRCFGGRNGAGTSKLENRNARCVDGGPPASKETYSLRVATVVGDADSWDSAWGTGTFIRGVRIYENLMRRDRRKETRVTPGVRLSTVYDER